MSDWPYPCYNKRGKSSSKTVFYVISQTVNNHPFEEVRTKVSCNDGFWDTRATCGFARDDKGKRIWDSQVSEFMVLTGPRNSLTGKTT